MLASFNLFEFIISLTAPASAEIAVIVERKHELPQGCYRQDLGFTLHLRDNLVKSNLLPREGVALNHKVFFFLSASL